MKHVSILVPKGELILSSVVGPFKVFKAANQYLQNNAAWSAPFFDLHLVGLEKASSLYDGAFGIQCDATFREVKKTDLILIPAFRPDTLAQNLSLNAALISWIREQRRVNGAEVASLCTGAFLLAATGLVDGKTCATHWAVAEMFKAKFPKVMLVPDKILVEQEGLYSSGGAYSFLNLIIHLVEKYCGREAAIFLSKFFEIEIDRDHQNQFAIFQGQKDHADSAIMEAQAFIESNLSQRISVEQLANDAAISRRNFVRRFKKATNNTPMEYIQRVRMEAAKRSLEATQKHVNEVMLQVGYSDEKAFRTVFKKHVGLSPIAYKSKYNRSQVAGVEQLGW